MTTLETLRTESARELADRMLAEDGSVSLMQFLAVLLDGESADGQPCERES